MQLGQRGEGGVLWFVEQVFTLLWRHSLFWMARGEYDPKGGAEHSEPWAGIAGDPHAVWTRGGAERQESPLNRPACHRSSLPPPTHTNTWIDNIVTGTELFPIIALWVCVCFVVRMYVYTLCMYLYVHLCQCVCARVCMCVCVYVYSM